MCVASSHLDHVRQTSGRNAALFGTHHIDGCEPLRQWQFVVLKQGTGGYRGLMVTLSAPMKGRAAENVRSTIIAARAEKKAVQSVMVIQFFKTGLSGEK